MSTNGLGHLSGMLVSIGHASMMLTQCQGFAADESIAGGIALCTMGMSAPPENCYQQHKAGNVSKPLGGSSFHEKHCLRESLVAGLVGHVITGWLKF